MLTRLFNKKLIEHAGFDTARATILNDGFVTVEVPYAELTQVFGERVAKTYDASPEGWTTIRFFDTYDLFLDWLCGDE